LTMMTKEDILGCEEVAISVGCHKYPVDLPYSPATAHPEYPFGPDALVEERNLAYEGVREALRLLELDAQHYGQKDWDPLAQVVRPGHAVVLKPNFVRDFRETRRGHENCLITHGAIIRAVLDYVYIALKGEGRIIIADAPQEDANFNEIRRIAGLDEIQEFYRRHAGFDVEVCDLRLEKARIVDGIFVGYDKLPGDPGGNVKVNLDQNSMFCEVSHLCHLLYGSESDTCELRLHHHDGIHEYLVSRTIMEADCVINLPKLKTHKKTGITVCMKNLVGINGNKNWLPHHRLGTPAQGGDQFADNGVKHRIEQLAMACFWGVFPFLGPMRKSVAKTLRAFGKGIFGDTNTDTIRSGNWYGNDTTWRMVTDLNRILMDPIAKPTGVVVVGRNPVAVDLACAYLMGFDFMRLPVLRRALDNHSLPLVTFECDDVICRSNVEQFDRPLSEFDGTGFAFKPHFGWRDHVELNCHQVSRTKVRPCAE